MCFTATKPPHMHAHMHALALRSRPLHAGCLTHVKVQVGGRLTWDAHVFVSLARRQLLSTG
jgi:hypothetical protein